MEIFLEEGQSIDLNAFLKYVKDLKCSIKAKKSRRRLNFYIRDGGFCYYCKRSISFEEATLDHKTPVSKRGSSKKLNIVIACEPCNNEKRNLSEKEYAAKKGRIFERSKIKIDIIAEQPPTKKIKINFKPIFYRANHDYSNQSREVLQNQEW